MSGIKDELDSLCSDGYHVRLEADLESVCDEEPKEEVDLTEYQTLGNNNQTPSVASSSAGISTPSTDLLTPISSPIAIKTEPVWETTCTAVAPPVLEDLKLDIPLPPERSPSLSPAPISSTENNNQAPSASARKRKLKKSPLYEPALLEPQGLPPVAAQVNNQYAYLYYRFVAERHSMWQKRLDGVAREKLSKDETMCKTFVGNINRQLDPSNEKMKRDIIGRGDQSFEEICFRIFLLCGFYLESTYKILESGLGEIPSWKNFNLEIYEAILYQASFVEKKVLYYSGFQQVPPTIYFGRTLPHYAATLRMIKAMMEMGLPQKLLSCKYASDASEIIRTIPTFGGFLSLCLLVNINEIPGYRLYYRNWATCGPGSRSYLKRLFGDHVINSGPMEQAGLKWLFDNQWKYWARLEVDPPHFWTLGIRPGLRVLDVENSLCWAHRYVNDSTIKGYRSLNDIPFPLIDEAREEGEGNARIPAYCDEERYTDTSSRATLKGDYDEEKEKLGELKDVGEEVYELEKIVSRYKGDKKDNKGLFRVRWKGWPPEDDTWEKQKDLMDGSAEIVQEWLDWEKAVEGAFEKINRDDPYTGPIVPKTIIKRAVVEGLDDRMRNKRKMKVTVEIGDEEVMEITQTDFQRTVKRSGRMKRRPEYLMDTVSGEELRVWEPNALKSKPKKAIHDKRRKNLDIILRARKSAADRKEWQRKEI